jgi:NAD(P)-dependent dehydrogenase (short-subunit alcohol dehydrogenase family)
MTQPTGSSGTVCAVTGGSGAIGSAIIRALHADGATAFSLDRTAPASPETPFLKCDVREDHSVAEAIAEIHRRHGRLDVLVHAAGVSRDAVVWKLEPEDWDLVQEVNLRGAFFLVRHGLPLMRRQKSGGRIVLIGSINGSRGKFGTSAYSASKAGLVGFAKSVARESGRFGVTVNVVEPGWVRTPLTDKVPKEVLDAALAESLLGTPLEVDDVAAAVLYLCSGSGRRVTGQILRVDGGQFLGPT